MRISSFVPFDRGFDDTGRSDEIDSNDIGSALPFAVVPICNIHIPKTFRFDAIQMVEQIFDSPNISPLMCHTRPYTFVAIDDSSLIITNNKSYLAYWSTHNFSASNTRRIVPRGMQRSRDVPPDFFRSLTTPSPALSHISRRYSRNSLFRVSRKTQNREYRVRTPCSSAVILR
ncbi:hypothetical protein ALC56_14286 [Trachymyrmex septentrionalis]|uniref:Uncharacterized protein n=1 Tax=Trachymyrmex septentrionalis TaxID=34720 RepID=A0A195ET27_9HYME|nr:hypothetical protein ALC56_14286 [Trachymyrmex septentrionalis]